MIGQIISLSGECKFAPVSVPSVRLNPVCTSIMGQLTLVRFRVCCQFSCDGFFYSLGMNRRVTPPRASSLDCSEPSLVFSLEPDYGGVLPLDFISKSLNVDGRYASTGLGRGNVYGLAAVCGALFPFMMFGRLYWPGSPMTNILFFVTAMLVSDCAGALGIKVLTIIRLSDILGITPTPPL